jgi:hypothetical protein
MTRPHGRVVTRYRKVLDPRVLQVAIHGQGLDPESPDTV